MRRFLRDFLVPHPENHYTPGSIRAGSLLAMGVLLLLTFAATNLQSLWWLSSDWLVGAVLPAVVVEETNSERALATLPTLTRNPVLDTAATMKAEHMAAEGYFAHYSPAGVSPWHWFQEAGYTFAHAGENLAVHFTDSSAVVDAWMQSPTHRANIVGAQYTEIGVGTAMGTYNGFETVFVVQLFGTPAFAFAGAESTTSVAPAVPTPDTSAVADEAPSPAPVPAQVLAAQDDRATTDETARPPLPQAVRSSFLATSSGLVPVTSTAQFATHDSTPSAALLTQPSKVFQFVYTSIAAGVLGALILAIVIEVRRQRPREIVFTCVLLALLAGLWYVHLALTTSVVIV